MRKNIGIFCGLLLTANGATANEFTDAIVSGKVYADLRLRYETVEQDNALKDATALTLRSRLGYITDTYKGFSAQLEFEDSRIVGGVGDYSVLKTGFKPNEFSTIADPETTEVDQALFKYKNDVFAAKLGRQVITYDNHRFVGHVGWRQDRQTFDGIKFDITPMDKFNISYSYITKRNRIFAEADDIDSKDNLLNISYKTSVGKISGYGYLLEKDDDTDNSLDTYGIRFNGKTDMFVYSLEYAMQESEDTGVEFDADYYLLEGGVKVKPIMIKLGYEVLGSDDGQYGFSTPLATLHKFNGWADIFLETPEQGLNDMYISVGGKVGKGKWALIYHDFSADESTDDIDDFGDEIDAVYSINFNKNYQVGVKYAAYSAGDAATNKVDTDKFWLWGTLKF